MTIYLLIPVETKKNYIYRQEFYETKRKVMLDKIAEHQPPLPFQQSKRKELILDPVKFATAKSVQVVVCKYALNPTNKQIY